jgi:hypothetical protein
MNVHILYFNDRALSRACGNLFFFNISFKKYLKKDGVVSRTDEWQRKPLRYVTVMVFTSWLIVRLTVSPDGRLHQVGPVLAKRGNWSRMECH